jgi:phage/plasmid-like protein (TIGR03299 family)
MAHEISIVNGRAEAFFALQPAWHGLGTVLDHAPTSEAAIAAAHLDWTVSREVVKTASGLLVPDTYATVRSDTNTVLGCVGDKYQIVQNRDAFAWMDSLLQDGLMRYESAGALRGGRTVWLLARLPSVDEIAPGDTTHRYILFSTSHDGSAALQALPTSVRVVCANTLRIATARSVGIRHTGDMKGKLDEARRYLSQFDSQFTLFRDEARKLAGKRLQGTEARDYINELFPEPDQATTTLRTRNRRDKQVEQIRANYRNGRQSIPAIRESWWALYNSVSELVDHQTTHRGTQRERQETHMLSVLDGTGANFKAKAFALALQMAG